MRKSIFLPTMLTACILLTSLVNGFAQFSSAILNNQPVTKTIGRIAMDNNGNTIISGSFRTTLTLGNNTVTNPYPNATSPNAGLVAKQAAAGSWTWVKTIVPAATNGKKGGGSTESKVFITKVATDNAGSIYLTGNYMGSVSFDNIVLTSVKNGPNHTWDVFTAKMSPAGAFLWAKSEGSAISTTENGLSVAVDVSGNVYTCGDAFNAVYLVKYSANGTKQWEKKYTNSQYGAAVATEGSDVYMTGLFSGMVNFGAGHTYTANGNANMFLLKLNGSGNVTWSRVATDPSSYGVFGYYIVVKNSELYVSGYFWDTANFGPGVTATTAVPNTANPYLAKYTTSGTCLWAVPTADGSDGSSMIFSHPSGIGTMAANTNESRLTVKEYSSNGAFVNSTTAQNIVGASEVSAYDVVSIPNGYMYSQNLFGSYDFGGTTIVASGTATSVFKDMVLVKYNSCTGCKILSAQGESTTKTEVDVYPNPAQDVLNISMPAERTIGTVFILDYLGRTIQETYMAGNTGNLDIRQLPSGLYLLKTEHYTEPIRFMKQ
jgi:hypothetical protein